MKINWKYVLLIAIIAFGFYVRSYHMGYPNLEYHDWKSTHYLTEARNFERTGFFKYGFFVPYADYVIGTDSNGVHPDTFPLTSILVGLAFKVTGPSILVARLLMILFSCATIFAMYLFAKKLFNNEGYGLIAAALTAINPLYIFFGRNVMLDPPALLFMILSGYYFMKWFEEDKSKYLILTTAFLTAATLTKYTYFILGIPMLCLALGSRVNSLKMHYKTVILCVLIMLLVPAWMLYVSTLPGDYGVKEALSGNTVRFGEILSSDFWATMKYYAADNYTLTGVAFAAIGLLFAVFSFKKSTGNKFLTYYLIGTLGWVFVLSYKLAGHSYHQYPIAPLFVLGMAYFILVVGETVSQFVKVNGSSWFIYAGLFFLLFFPSMTAANRQFDTQFYGLDVAGEYIKTHSELTDKILTSGHQSYGLHWSSDRFGRPLPGNVEDLKEFEAGGARWILLYQWGISVTQDKSRWDYIQANYMLRQVGFVQNQLIYLLLERGGTFNESNLNEMLQGVNPKTKDYQLTSGIVTMTYANFD